MTKPLRSFAERGQLGALLEIEQRCAGGDLRAFLHREFFQTAREGRGEVDEFTFEVALITIWSGAITGRYKHERKEPNASGEFIYRTHIHPANIAAVGRTSTRKKASSLPESRQYRRCGGHDGVDQ